MVGDKVYLVRGNIEGHTICMVEDKIEDVKEYIKEHVAFQGKALRYINVFEATLNEEGKALEGNMVGSYYK